MHVDPRNRRERRFIIASLVASVGIHAAAFGIFPTVATGFGEPPAPISVSLRTAPPAPVALPEEAARLDPIDPPAPAMRRAPRPALPERRMVAARPAKSHVTVRVTRLAPTVRPPVAVAPQPGSPRSGRQPDAGASNASPTTLVSREPARKLAAAVTTPPSFRADYLSNPAPAYPRRARRDGMEGTVTLKVRVTAKGVPGEVKIETSSGFDTLDRAAVDAVKAWQFVPARRGDDAIEAWVLVPVAFRLESG